jgi:7-carboxy-7-deazaguanine synthase
MSCVTDGTVKPGYLSEIFVSFQGEGAHVGRRHLFVRLAGCNIRCRYCDTPDSLERTATYTVHEPNRDAEVRSNPADAEELSGIVGRLIAADAPIDAIALTGGEPLTQSEFLAAFLEIGRSGVPILLETNGILPRRLRDVLPLVDIISMDIKLPSNTGESEFWDAHAEFLDLARAKDLYVKILVDEGTADADVERATRMIASAGPTIPAFLQPVVDPAGRVMIGAERLTDLYRLAWRSLSAVRVLPQAHKLLGLR